MFVGGESVRVRVGVVAQTGRTPTDVSGDDRAGATLEALAGAVVVRAIDVALRIEQARLGGLEGTVVLPAAAAHRFEQNGNACAADYEQHRQQQDDEDDEQ
ncbi:hypothetical protein AX767_18060 [Variovorax sp. PAMC 28711]|nr:hypothetical protein AX767_18060 [Variovorax sp. PAMC 28711]